MTVPSASTWETEGQHPWQVRDLLAFALQRSAVAAVVLDEDCRFVFAANMPDCWELPERAEPCNVGAVFGEELGDRITDLTNETAEKGEPAEFDALGPDDRYFQFVADKAGTAGQPFTLLTIIELTDERWREQRLRALLRELSHRSKNLLAIILSVATQTAKTTSSIQDFLGKFRGRVYSISHSQDLITDANWHGARFRDLVWSQADKYYERPEDALVLSGADPLLSPNEALHLGLAIHELFVDAIAVGETSESYPSITVSCQEKSYDGRPGFEITWEQSNPAELAEDDAVTAKVDGFHSTVLNRITPVAIGGEGEYQMHDEGPYYRIHFPQAEQTVRS